MRFTNTGKKLLLFLLLVPLLANATGLITWNKNEEFMEIGNRIERLDDTSSKLTIEQVSDSANKAWFKPSNNKVLNFGFAGNPAWLKISVANNTPDILYLSLEQALLPVADFYFKNDSGQWQCYKAGYNVDINNKKIRNHYQVFPLTAGQHDYYVRLISFSPPVTVKIWNADAFELSAATQKIAYGIYIGLLAFVIILNLFFAYAYRLRMYLYYSVLVFFYLLVSGLVMDGYGIYFFHHINFSFTYILLPELTTISIIPFAFSFLEVKKYAPRVYQFSRVFLGWVILYTALLVFIPQRYALVINQVHAMIITGLMITIGVSVGPHHNKIGYYFAGAYLFFFILVLSQIAYMQTGFPPCPFGISHVSVAIFVESMLLAYLLTRRLRWEETALQMAKDETQAQLLYKTRENEQLIRNQNVILEETVKQRTKEIALQKEIAERALSEKEVLLKEIHHRVKNNLQTISSMLMLQSVTLSDAAAKNALAESQSRVRSMALVHQKLYQTEGLEKVELGGLVESLVSQISSLYQLQTKNVSITKNIPVTPVLMDKAIPLGLILNELLTNTYKHAFGPNQMGSIFISIQYLPSYKQGAKRVIFTYADSGKGIADADANPAKLGLRLVNLLAEQIGATMDYSNTKGSEFVFIFNINT